MSTTNVSTNRENDILSVIRDLEGVKPAAEPTIDGGPAPVATESPDPAKLLESLQNKRKLITMLDGYGNVGGISEMKEKLNEAISDLEGILEVAE